MAEREVHPIVRAAQEIAPSVARQSTEMRIMMGPELSIDNLDDEPVIPSELLNSFTSEGEEYLNSNPVATVIVMVEAKVAPDVSSVTRPRERRKKEEQAGKENLKGLLASLESAKETDETIIFKPQYRNSSVKLKAPSSFVRSLTEREDVTEIRTPRIHPPKAPPSEIII